MKKLLALFLSLSLACLPASGQFTPGQVLGAAQLNAALAAPNITGGSINNSPIGGTTPSTGKFTTLSTTGALTASGTIITPGIQVTGLTGGGLLEGPLPYVFFGGVIAKADYLYYNSKGLFGTGDPQLSVGNKIISYGGFGKFLTVGNNETSRSAYVEAYNTATSTNAHAILRALNSGTLSSPFVQLTSLGAGVTWYVGNDVPNSNRLAVGLGATPGAGDLFTITTAGVARVATAVVVGNSLTQQTTTAGIVPTVQLHGNSQQLSTIATFNWATSATPSGIDLNKSRGGNVAGTQGAVSAGDQLGVVRFNGSDGTAIQNGFLLRAFANETWSGTANGTNAEIQILPATSTTAQTAMIFSGLADSSSPFVGIGTSNAFQASVSNRYPLTRLHIASFTGNASNQQRSELRIQRGIALATTFPTLTFYKDRGVSMDAPVAISSSDSIGQQGFFGYVGSTGTWVEGARVQVDEIGAVNDTATGLGMTYKILTRATGGALTTAVTVDQTQGLTVAGHTTFEGVTSTGATGTGKLMYDTSPTATTSIISPLFRSTVAKVLLQGTGSGATQLAATQTTPPTCTSNCGTSPAIVGTDSSMIVTMGATGSPASGFVITFNGTWAAIPSCVAQSALSGMVVGKMPIVASPTTTTLTITTNGTAPANSDKYAVHCIGVQ